jgi:TonB family protein
MSGTLRSSLNISILAGCVLIAAALVVAQTKSSTGTAPAAPAKTTVAVSMPKRPDEILKVASNVNGLAAPGLSAWHIKASYQIFDDVGNAEPAGTFEEFWVSPANFKRAFISPEFNENEFGTDHGLYRAGDQDWPDKAEFVIHNSLIDPIPEALNSLGLHLKKKLVPVGTAKLQCLTLQSQGAATAMGVYCFERQQPMLRLAASWDGKTQTEFNDIVIFQSRYIARDIRTYRRGKPVFLLHVDVLEPLSKGQKSTLAPPSTAIPITAPLVLPQTTAPNLLVWEAFPIYPQAAKLSHIQGTVLIDVVVGKDGNVERAQVVSGPKELRDSALIAVRNWKYQPFLFAGDPLAFRTQVQIIFSIR